ncbi:MAG: phosphatidylinositol mannoside acyltransferase [Actinomycetes bacterium]
MSLAAPVRDRASDLTYAAGWAAVQRLPEPAARLLFEKVADAAYRRNGSGVRRLRGNLAHVLAQGPSGPPSDSEVDRVCHAAMRSYLRYWLEAFRLPTWSPKEVTSRMVVHGYDHLAEAIGEGRGVVVVTGHLGNWDHVAAWAATQGIAVTTVAERLKPESLYERFVAYRESLGMEVLPLTGDADLTAVLLKRLNEGRVLALVADRDLSQSAIDVRFLGRPARMPGGPAALALRADSVLMPLSSWYDGAHTHMRLHPRLVKPAGLRFRDAVPQLTQQFADVIGTAILEHPADWHMLQRIWAVDDERAAA